MGNQLISVIVPVYNAEDTIERCLNSILGQTWQNLEVLLIDDGSTDYSANICIQYQNKDSRIRFFQQENLGLSKARNKGLDHCHGDYIAFVDSDDWIESDMYEIMLNHSNAFGGGAIIVCQWRDLPKKDYLILGKHSSILFSRNLYAGEYLNGVVCAPWNKLYPAHIFHQIRFKGEMAEDEDLNDRVFATNVDVIVIPECLYHYCYNENSLTRQRFNRKRLHFLDVLVQRIELFRDDEFILRETEKLFLNIYIEYYYKCRNNGIHLEKKYHTYFKNYFNDLWKYQYCNTKFYIRMLVFLLSPNLYELIIIKIRNIGMQIK